MVVVLSIARPGGSTHRTARSSPAVVGCRATRQTSINSDAEVDLRPLDNIRALFAKTGYHVRGRRILEAGPGVEGLAKVIERQGAFEQRIKGALLRGLKLAGIRARVQT